MNKIFFLLFMCFVFVHTPVNAMLALHSASAAGDVSRITALLSEKDIDVDQQDTNYNVGRTALFWAAGYGHPKIVQLLLQAGANVAPDNYWGWTPLHEASLHNHKTIVQFLIKAHANIDKQDYLGYTPLHLAAEKGLHAIVSLLLNAGANPDVRNNWGNTSSDLASVQGYTAIANIITQWKPNQRARSRAARHVFAQGLHHRLGAHSPIRLLDGHCMRRILQYVHPENFSGQS